MSLAKPKGTFRFWFHYNKPEARKKGKPQITVHWKGQCLIVDNIKEIGVPTEGHLKDQQPHFVIRGWANNVEINKQNEAIIK